MYEIMVAIHVVAAICSVIAVYIVAVQRPSYFQKLLSMATICSLVSIVAYNFELLADSKEQAIQAAQFGYLGKCYITLLLIIFATKYCDVKFPNIVRNIWIVAATFFLFIVMTANYHKLYYSSIKFDKTSEIRHLELGRGPIYYVFAILTLVSMIAYIWITHKCFRRRQGIAKRRVGLLNMAGIIPSLLYCLNAFRVFAYVDFTPLGIVCSSLIISYNVLKYGLLDTVQLANESMMNTSSNGIIVVSSDKNLLFANKMAYEIFPEINDKNTEKAMISYLFNNVEEEIRMRKNEKKREYHQDGVFYELNYFEIVSETGKVHTNSGYMLCAIDKTFEHNYINEIECLKEEAELANKTKTMFLAKMSHEIRTPMNGIMGFADLTLTNNLDKETEEYVRYIKSSASSLLTIINDILDITKIEAGNMNVVEVEYEPMKIMSEIAAMFKTQAEAVGLEFNVEFPKTAPRMLKGDYLKIKEILINILGNAVKYTEKGEIIFSVEVEKIGDTANFTFRVKDTGKGIKEEYIDLIFETFGQTDEKSNYMVVGTGLGLPISKQLSELLGGTITVNSTYGVGSEFVVTIPQTIVSGEQGEDVSYAEHIALLGNTCEIVAKGLRVLVADDNEINLKVVAKLLEKHGAVVDTAKNGLFCIDKLDENEYDVVLMDHMMPEMDGMECLKAIRACDKGYKDIPVILVTANAIVGVKEEMLEAGFDGFVTKPIDESALEAELLRIMSDDKVSVNPISNEKETHEKTVKSKEKKITETLKKVGIDTLKGMKYIGNFDEYIEVLELSYKEFSEKAINLNGFYVDEDWKNYAILVHSMKSDLITIGESKLSGVAKMLEMAGKEERISDIKDKHEEFIEEYKHIMDTIGEVLGLKKHALKAGQSIDVSGRETEKETMTEEEWNSYLSSIEHLAKELESDDIIELANEMLAYSLSDVRYAIVKKLIRCVDSFDMQGVKTCVKEAKLLNL